MASWYGPGFEGTAIASGEPINASDCTAGEHDASVRHEAYRHLYRSVAAWVDDCGPFSGVGLDLPRAAKYIGLLLIDVDAVSADPSTPTAGLTPVTQNIPR
ncbi:MAG: hypothetical protein M3305_13350 [Actinomycetota bacterium]|nr:hypothetical protein [Actinomycetota bacterium]